MTEPMTPERLNEIEEINGVWDNPFDLYPIIDELLAEVSRLRADNARLAAIVDRLPLTADGVRVIPGTDLVHAYHDGEKCAVGMEIVLGVDSGMWATFDGSDRIPLWRCYSTRDAALAALT